MPCKTTIFDNDNLSIKCQNDSLDLAIQCSQNKEINLTNGTAKFTQLLLLYGHPKLNCARFSAVHSKTILKICTLMLFMFHFQLFLCHFIYINIYIYIFILYIQRIEDLL